LMYFVPQSMAVFRGLLRFGVSLGRLSTEPTYLRQSLKGMMASGVTSPAACEAETGGAGQESAPAADRPHRAEWSPQSRRTGVIAVKLGMTQMWGDTGDPVPVTVLQVPCS
jgi:hypothetical protein